MILSRLVDLADRMDDLPPPGYGRAFVTKVIRLGGDGTLKDVITLSGEKRGTREGKEFFVPREQPQRTVGVVPRLIADNPNYVLGLPREKDKPHQVAQRHEAFCSLIKDCAAATKEPSVEAISTWILSGGPAALMSSGQVAGGDDLIFEIDGIYPTELPVIRDYWINRESRQHLASCLVTGKYGPVVDRMPSPIKGIPGGQVSGTSLISVNNPAGCSYGLEAALNSPIGKGPAEKIGNALNYLLASDQHSLRVGKTIYVFWTRQPTAFNPFQLLKDPQPEDVQHLLTSAQQGATIGAASEKDFFVLSLSANISRVVVRDYHETTLETARANLTNWFGKLRIVDAFGEEARPVSIFRLAVSLFRDARDMPAHVPVALVKSALAGTPLPAYLLGLAVKRNLAMQGPFTEYNGVRRLSSERMSLVKAILQQKEGIPLESLQSGHPDAAYHCGRLLAVLERLQYQALGNINSTVVDRFYGAACTSPATILGNLVNDAQAHLGKLRKEHRDGWHQRRIEEVLTAIGMEFPKTLSLPRQGLFALGFYHQKAADRAAATKNKELQVEGDE